MQAEIRPKQYEPDESGFRAYLSDAADELFPFPGYRQYQDEILYETLEAMFVDNYRNIIIEGPTGIGKSPVNVTVGRVVSLLESQYDEIQSHFDVELEGISEGNAFYTTPQKSLRNQLAEDEDLREYVSMLQSRADYKCRETGQNCSECQVRSSEEESCMTVSDCTYWNAKEEAMNADIAVLTFAMLVVDNYLPERIEQGGGLQASMLNLGDDDEKGRKISFGHRDLVIVDEAHNAEGQSASMFAGFTLSPWTVPKEVYDKAGERVSWDADRFEDVEDIVSDIARRCTIFIEENENNPMRQSAVEKCQSIRQKIGYCLESWGDGKGWVVNVEEVVVPGSNDETTKAIQVKPVRVGSFLQNYVWSRAERSLITSATIPFRGNIDKWADRIGLEGDTKFISRPTPFPEEHRQIHLNTTVGKMSGDAEDHNWHDAMETIREIHGHHQGEKGLIHSVSYSRAESVGDFFDIHDEYPDVIVDDEEYDSDAVIDRWQNSDTDILVSPRMVEGVDLHGDLCRWQVLLKVPFGFVGDSRVSYLLNECHEWQWYKEEAAMKTIQAVGRAVRGPEPEEAATFYVIDEKFDELMHATTPPEYIGNAVRDDAPLHWKFPKTAPWR